MLDGCCLHVAVLIPLSTGEEQIERHARVAEFAVVQAKHVVEVGFGGDCLFVGDAHEKSSRLAVVSVAVASIAGNAPDATASTSSTHWIAIPASSLWS